MTPHPSPPPPPHFGEIHSVSESRKHQENNPSPRPTPQWQMGGHLSGLVSVSLCLCKNPVGAACKGTSQLIDNSVGVTHTSSHQARGHVGTCDLWARAPLLSLQPPGSENKSSAGWGAFAGPHSTRRHGNRVLGGTGERVLILFLDHVSWSQHLVKKRT